ncbi:MAG: hypothetical protein ABII12_02055 [Planctomycetota bacterium]
MDYKIQKLDSSHLNYGPPFNARWYCIINDVEYFNKTREGLKDHVERMAWNQKNDSRKNPWPGNEPKSAEAESDESQAKDPGDMNTEAEKTAKKK